MKDETLENAARRTFLMSAGATACAAGLSACMHTNAARVLEVPPASGAIKLRLADEPELASVGGAIKLKPPGFDDTILLWRSGPSEFAATSIACTHMGCEVEVAEAGKSLACPCHGSRFEADGTVRHGPAAKALHKYVVESTDTEVTVHLTSPA